MNNIKVLITGGSGMVGRYLTSILLSEGYEVIHLSRQQGSIGRVRVCRWDPGKKIIDPVIFDGVDYIIHLAGANIGEKRWTRTRKDEILRSRIETAIFLYDTITTENINLKAFISASATGYYGSVTTKKIFTEADPPASDFTGTTCRLWEESADLFRNKGVRVVKIRSAVVLEKTTGVLSRILKPARSGIFPILGSGCQHIPWIHIADLCNIFLKAVRDENMSGTYNAVAPEHTDYRGFQRTLAKVLNKKGIFIHIPGFFLRALFGEMSGLMLKGSRVSAEKILKADFKFIFPGLSEALENLIIN